MASTRRSLTAGVLTAALVVALAVASLAGLRSVTRAPHTLSVHFTSASGLVLGSDVLEAGARVGSVTGIVPTARDEADVQVTVTDDHWPLHQGVTAGIRPKSLLGEKYVDLHDGAVAAGPFDGRATVPAAPEAVPVELDQFINSLDPSARKSARILLGDLGAGVAGRGPDLNQAIAAGTQNLQNLAVTGRTLNNRDPDLDRIILGLNGVLDRLTRSDQLDQLSQLISNGQQTLNAIEAERASFSRQFVDAQAALVGLNGAIDSAVPQLRDTLAVAPHLLAGLTTEGTLLTDLGHRASQPAVLDALVKGLQGGPTSTGGATEIRADGSTGGIFRICLLTPSLPVPAAGGAPCTGNGYRDPAPAATPARVDGGNGMAAFAAFLGA